ncbi:ABC transporter ATP-binding protein [Guptibacillus hwajinpoensis]|uniref:Peptide/nickel transport system ATP-binding protein n=1 Tax=Guptibacillus hwajinpoensis TaxID=208199 RepID=A0ABU0K3Z9_9BACL|nr:ABC transporter ATP-binding protein [Alkalihalobacillus hemicentroti]MDQ0484083.1 peptide/nickel transport system ATP-binding protein [Alkalihalobacillus hemicentroti]
MEQPVLNVSKLKTHFFTDDGEIPAVDSVDFHINKGEVLGIVGESGSGKSVTSLSIMQLIQAPGKVVGGEITYKGENLLTKSEKEMRKIRGNEIGMIFQEPMTSLNPVFRIGNQLIEGIRIHKKWSKKKSWEHAISILKLVGLPRAEELMNEYPHQLSGGMRQRVMIAMAMACDPEVLIADEPTTALDVTIQAQILELMKKLNRETNTSIILITHDLGVVAEICDRIVVMYSGKIVEQGKTSDIFQQPKHPYTIGLIESVPDVRVRKDRLYSIPGNVPKPGSIQKGCHFAPRCSFAFDKCFEEDPVLLETGSNQQARCWLHEDEKKAAVLERVNS